MNAQEIQNIVEARYNRASWLKLLHGVFGAKVKFFATPTTLTVEKAIASEAVYLGDVTLQDDHKIAVYEVHLSEHVNIERNRAGIRNLLCSQWRGAGFAGAFMLCYRNSESVLRFSYVSESWAFNEEGAYKKESTDALRFTYLLGEGHRSRTAVRQFMELANSGLTLKDVTKAFSVEALSKRFFNEYKEKYEDVVEYVTGKRVVKSGSKWEMQTTHAPNRKIMAQFAAFADPEKAVRDYVKKLMGRLVFIQFLQKKGWMGVPANDSAWKNGDKDFVQNLFKNTKNKDSFIDDVLEPLFDDLNTKRENDLVSSEMVGKGIKVPYLNGGLFEKDAQDNTEFPLPKKYMEELLEFFTQYNFTIDENDPDDAEVGVDPEMLSCIFENLLEDNKEKGAFYTPKEIVQYMCRESLIAHLCNGVKKNETKERIRDFVLSHKVDVLNGEDDNSGQVDEKLKNVKICDPAIGSGAFPMGLMRELYFCRSAIEGFDHAKAAEIKKLIIQQNIYGVDIEKGAVDIARLRFWLSLIVDEETPHALPNLDFKIMQGNSLLEQYEGVDLSDITYKASKDEKKNGRWFDLFDSGLTKNKQLVSFLKDKFFDCEDHETKRQIRNALKSEIQALLQEKGCSVKLDAIKDVTATDQFFLWHTWFSEVFEQGGFDIVIGNPPYIKEYRNKAAFDGFRESSPYYIGKMDLWYGFACHGLDLLRMGGVLCFIAQNNWTTSAGAKLMRNKVVVDSKIRQLLDFNTYMVFENASIQTMIMLFERNKKDDKYSFDYRMLLSDAKKEDMIALLEKRKMTNTKYLYPEMKRNDYKNKIFTFNENDEIFDKIAKNKFFLVDDEIGQGIVPALDDYFIVTDKRHFSKEEQQYIKPFYTGLKDRFTSYSLEKYLIYMSAKNYNKSSLNDFPNIKAHFEPYKQELKAAKIKYGTPNKPYFFVHRERDESFFKKGNEKIVAQSRCARPTFYYTKEDFYGSRALFFIRTSRWNMRLLTGILNSRLIDFWLRGKGKIQGAMLKLDKEPILSIPLPKNVSEIQQQPIITLVDQILAAKKANPQADTSDLEHQIDQLVYKLYDLTLAEIETIENN